MKTNSLKFRSKALPIPGLKLSAWLAAGSLSAASLLAGTSTWNGASTASGNWSDAANWGGTVAVSGNAFVFGGTARQTNTNDVASLTLAGVTLSTANWNLPGLPVTLSGTLTASVSGTSTWGLPTVLSGGVSMTQSALVDILNFTGNLSGTGSFYKTAGSTGQGQNYLTNPTNSFTGGVYVRTGTLYYYNLFPAGTNSSLGAGTVIQVGSTATGYGANLVYLGTNNGATDRTLALQNANTGAIGITNNSPNNSSLTFNGPVTLVDNTSGTGNFFPLLLGGTSTGTNTFAGQLGSGSPWLGNLTISGPGTWAFSNVVNFAGNLTVATNSHVALLYNSLYPSYTEIPALAQITMNSGATLDVSSYDLNGSPFVLGSGGSSYPQVLIAGRTNGAATDIYGSLSLAGTGEATLKVAGANAAGTLTISSNFIPASGTITMDLGTNTVAGGSTNDLIAVGGNLDLSQGTALIAITALKGSVLTNAPYTLISYTGSLLGGNTNLSVSSPSRAYLPGTVSTATPGLIKVSFAPSGQTNASLVWQGNAGQNWDQDITANWLNGSSSDYFFGGDNVRFDDTSSDPSVNLVGTLSPGSMVVSNNINAYTLASTGSGMIGAGALLKQGPGALTITTPNTFAGGTMISAGSVTAGNNTALGAGPITLGDLNTDTNAPTLWLGPATLANAITVSSNGTGGPVIGCALSGTLNGAVNLQQNLTLANTGTYNSANALLVQGGITGTGNVTVQGGGFVKWQTGPCNFSGNIAVTGTGTMLDINTALNTNVNVFVDSGALLGDVDSPTINCLSGTGEVVPGPGLAGNCTLYIGAAGGSSTFAGTFGLNSGNYSCNVVKAGGGTITFTGDNSLSAGITTVSNGTLVVNNATGYGLGTGSVTVYGNLVINNTGGYGSGNGIISVAPGGVLSGTGSVYSATHTLQVSGVLAVGNAGDTSGATFTVINAGIIINTNGALSVNLYAGAGAGDNTANAADADVLLAQTSTVNLNAGSILNVGNPNNLSGWKVGDNWQIIKWTAAPNGTFTTLNLPVLTGGLAWDVSQLYTNGTIGIIVGAPTASAQILGVSYANGSLVLTGTNNNVPNTSFHYAVLTPTNVATPLAQWTALATNGFNANGTFSYTNTFNPATPALFFNVEAVP